jgi:hypothetical protein
MDGTREHHVGWDKASSKSQMTYVLAQLWKLDLKWWWWWWDMNVKGGWSSGRSQWEEGKGKERILRGKEDQSELCIAICRQHNEIHWTLIVKGEREMRIYWRERTCWRYTVSYMGNYHNETSSHYLMCDKSKIQ